MPARGRRPASRKPRTSAARDSGATPEESRALESVLPMELQVGDRLIDQDFEWEVVSRPEVLHGAKTIRARTMRPGLPESEREVTWPAHVHVTVRRGASR